MTLDQAIATIDLPQVDGIPAFCSETGECYVAIVPGGVKPEGGHSPFFCLSESEAVKHWLAAFNNYAEGKVGTLYWRERPIMDSIRLFQADDPKQEFGYTFYLIWSRLVITDKPVLAKDHERVKRYYEAA